MPGPGAAAPRPPGSRPPEVALLLSSVSRSAVSAGSSARRPASQAARSSPLSSSASIEERADDPPALPAKRASGIADRRRAGRSAPSPTAAARCAPTRPACAAISAKEKPQKNFRSTTWARSGSKVASSSRASLTRTSSLSSAAGSATSSSSEVISNCPPRLWAWRLRDVVDDQAAHHPRRVGHEPAAVRERRALALGHVEIGLVQQRGRAEGQVGRRPRASWRLASRCSSE